jgi:hypothetical protein
MSTLNIVRSAPDEMVERFISALSAEEGDTVVSLYEGNVDWAALVDAIFSHDKVISWW